MDELQRLKLKSIIDFQYIKIKHNREQLESNHPTRVDLINSMKETEQDLLEVCQGVRMLCDEVSFAYKRIFAVEKNLLEKQSENDKLKTQNKNLVNNVQL